MKIRHKRVGVVAVTTATAGMVAATLATAPAAFAAPAAPAAPPDHGAVASSLASKLGSQTAGSYLKGGKLVVTVTDADAAQTVRAAGAVPKTVARSGSDLNQVMAALKRDATVPGTAWAVDADANQVLLTMDSTVKGAALKKVRAAAAKHGAAVRTERVAGKFQKFALGGEAIYSGSSRCSLGFNVRSGSGAYYFVTAGHCTNGSSTWTDRSGRTLGRTVASSFPGNDYGVVQYSGTPADTRGAVSLYSGTHDITRSGNATVGQTVYRSGSTTGLHNGQVTALNQTVNYAQGSVSGLIRTTVCAEPGDSGGALFAPNTALGLTSGGSGNCRSGGTTFFQPVSEVLNRYGLSVY